MTASLAVDKIACRRGNRAVLADVSLVIESGECVVLAGESGSGKTSLLRLIGGLDRADRGQITIGDTLVENSGIVFVPPERRRLGMVFQDFALWPHLSVLENVALAVPRGQDRKSRASDLLDRLGVAACASRLPASLSGGQQQRIGIARAIAAVPRLLLLDEPFSSLDLETRESLRAELRALIAESGLTALCVSHDPADCVHLGDRVAVLESGRISQCGAPEALFAAPASPYAARLAGLLGGIVVETTREQDDLLLRFGPVPVRIAGAGAKFGGAPRLRAFWPDDALQPDEAGAIPATCLSVRFDAGAYRAFYRLDGVAQPVPIHTRNRPALGAGHLAIATDRLRLFLPEPLEA